MEILCPITRTWLPFTPAIAEKVKDMPSVTDHNRRLAPPETPMLAELDFNTFNSMGFVTFLLEKIKVKN